MRRKVLLVVISLLALLSGCLIYIVYNPKSYITDFAMSFSIIRYIEFILPKFDSLFLQNHFADCMWSLSLCCILQTITTKKKLSFALSVTVGVIWEFLQFTHITNGTGDIVDIFMYTTASFVAVLI